MAKGYGESELKQLNLGAGDRLYGDGGLVLLKALLQSGVSYLGGYPGAPVAHMMDAISDAYDEILKPRGIHFDQSGNEASAAALFTASQTEKIRGAICWKILGNNVAADALAHHALIGVEGGALVIVGEDYGLDSTTVPQRSLPFAVNLSMPVIDPRADLQVLADLTEHGFQLSEAAHLPAMFLLRTRVANIKGSITCRENAQPAISMVHTKPWTKNPLKNPQPVNSRRMDVDRVEKRLPAAREYILRHNLNEHFTGTRDDIGIITHGVVYNVAMRSLNLLGHADVYGTATPSVLQLNVVHPLVPEQVAAFLRDKKAVLIMEEGFPAVLEEEIRAIAQRNGITTPIYGKDLMPLTGEMEPHNVMGGLVAFLEKVGVGAEARSRFEALEFHIAQSSSVFELRVVPRTPTFCTGCPERPIFTALKIMGEDLQTRPFYNNDVGCYSLGIMAPFTMGDSNIGMGLGLASGAIISRMSGEKTVSFMGDGTFWHSGLTTSIANAVHNNQDGTLVIFENFWTSMTGSHENPATGFNMRGERSEDMNIERTVKSAGVKWVKRVNPYNLKESLAAFKEAHRSKGLKIIISTAECMLTKQRRERDGIRQRIKDGERMVTTKLGVDDDVCTGDHSCMRYNGCPSLTLKSGPNPLREDPVATIDLSCAGCGLCGEIAHAANLCPSFFEVQVVDNPTWLDRLNAWFVQLLVRRSREGATVA